jgi:hypothetical protein
MNKENFVAILQVALWKFEGISDSEIMINATSAEISPAAVKAGIKLTSYLKSKEI